MKPEYMPRTLSEKFGKLIEECGEVMAAVGKTMRWGLEGVNPELPASPPRETNREWILREMADVEESIAIVRAAIALPVSQSETVGTAMRCIHGVNLLESYAKCDPCAVKLGQKLACHTCGGCGFSGVLVGSRRELTPCQVCSPAQPAPERPTCEVPPPGWYCTRAKGHEGPCAAWLRDEADHGKPTSCANCGHVWPTYPGEPTGGVLCGECGSSVPPATTEQGSENPVPAAPRKDET